MSDIEAIEQLSALYNFSFDQGDLETWLSTFTPNGRFERSNGLGPSIGHDQLRAMGESFTTPGRHITSGAVITVDGDTATQTCYLQWLSASEGYCLGMFGIYRDRLVRSGGRWRFAARQLEVL